SVLPSKSFAVLSLPKSADITLALAISHDCDIANDNLDAEPTVEFVLGRVVDKSNGNYGFGKNHRVLHLPATLEGKPATLELLAIRKISIHKEDLATHEPDERFVLEMKPRQILQSWLAARYRRQALPDRLVARLRPVFD